MGFLRLIAWLMVSLASAALQAESSEPPIIVTGKLVRAMAIGGESTGWALELEAAITVDGQQMNLLPVSCAQAGKLEELANKQVVAAGTLIHRHGVETGEQPVLDISSIKEAERGHATKAVFNLWGGEWRLQDLGGLGVLENSHATLGFPGAGKVAGNGSCNRFFGSVEIHGDAIKVGPLASSRMACPESVMSQEAKYVEALRAAERFEWKDPYLLIYCKGLAKPLRFIRMVSEKPPGPSTKPTTQ